jgi:hypothetical protein
MNTFVSEADVKSNGALVLQNGKSVYNPEVEKYVVRYKSFLKKTAEAVLGLAETLAEAKVKLNGVDFHYFCNEVGTPEGSATYSKLLKIAENSARFQPFVDRLPNTWTTIYKLAKLPSEKFERVSANLTPFITAREINEIVGEEKEPRNVEHYDIKLSFEDLLPEQKAKIYGELDRLKAEYSFKVQETMDFKEEMMSYKTANKV